MKKIFLFFLMTVIGANIFAQERKVIDKLVANVGNEYVLLSDLEEMYARMAEERGGLPPEARCNLLENLLASKLLLNQARLDSVEVGDEEVEAQLNARIDQILSFMGGSVKQFEEYYGQSTAEVKARFRDDLESQLLVERMQAQVMQEATVTPSEVKEFYQRIPQDSLPYFNSEVELGEIVYKVPVNKEQKIITKQRLEEIRTRILEGGEDFAELAKKFSDDLGSGSRGGELGWTKRGSFVPEFEAAAYNLEKGEYSRIIESEFGYHFMQLLDRRGNSINVRHILLKPPVLQDDKDKAIALLDSVNHIVSIDSLPFGFAVKLYSDKNQQSYNNNGRMVNPKTGNTFFEIADLEPDVYFTIDTMEVGEVSSPIEFDMRGDPAYRMVVLQSRTNPHRANLKEDYDKIRSAAIEERKARFMSDWIEGRINSTYIRIDQEYEGCPNLKDWKGEQETVIRP